MEILSFGYKSNPLKKRTFRSPILNILPSIKVSMKARSPQFGHLQYIEDLRMHYTLERFADYGK
jgi:hypothetical protein